MAKQSIQNNDEKRSENVYAPLNKLLPQPVEGELFGVKIKDISPYDQKQLEKGNLTVNTYNINYTTKEGKTINTEAKLRLEVDRRTGDVRPSFIAKLEKPDIKEYSKEGKKWTEAEMKSLQGGYAVFYENKPVFKKDGVFTRTEKSYLFASEIDPKTNQIVTQNLDINPSFKFPEKLFGKELSPQALIDLKTGKSIKIENPVIGGEKFEGEAKVRYSPVINNFVRYSDEKLKASYAKRAGKSVATSPSQKETTQTNAAKQSTTKKQTKAVQSPKI